MNMHAAPAAPAKETKAEKFVRLAEARVSRVLEDVRLVTQLVARTYEHSPEQANVIVSTLANAVATVAKAFEVPFTFRIDKVGVTPAKGGILANPRASAHVETSRYKTGIAKALEAMKTGDHDQAKALLLDLL